MADFAGQEQSFVAEQGSLAPATANERPFDREQGYLGASAPTRSFVMRARDAGRSAGSDYVVWIARGEADFIGDGYGGATPTPIGAMVVGSVVVQS